jgi:hypothetical protein
MPFTARGGFVGDSEVMAEVAQGPGKRCLPPKFELAFFPVSGGLIGSYN